MVSSEELSPLAAYKSNGDVTKAGPLQKLKQEEVHNGLS